MDHSLGHSARVPRFHWLALPSILTSRRLWYPFATTNSAAERLPSREYKQRFICIRSASQSPARSPPRRSASCCCSRVYGASKMYGSRISTLCFLRVPGISQRRNFQSQWREIYFIVINHIFIVKSTEL